MSKRSNNPRLSTPSTPGGGKGEIWNSTSLSCTVLIREVGDRGDTVIGRPSGIVNLPPTAKWRTRQGMILLGHPEPARGCLGEGFVEIAGDLGPAVVRGRRVQAERLG